MELFSNDTLMYLSLVLRFTFAVWGYSSWELTKSQWIICEMLLRDFETYFSLQNQPISAKRRFSTYFPQYFPREKAFLLDCVFSRKLNVTSSIYAHLLLGHSHIKTKPLGMRMKSFLQGVTLKIYTHHPS